MVIHTNRWYRQELLFIATALALGLAVIVTMSVGIGGRADRMFTEELPATLLMLAPFVITGVVAGVASRRGTVVGCCALLGGIVVVPALHYLAYLGEQEGLKNHAWTGAALAKGLFVFAAIPAALVGSCVGLWIGRALVRSGRARATDRPDRPAGAGPQETAS
jgi:hypothetical protein